MAIGRVHGAAGRSPTLWGFGDFSAFTGLYWAVHFYKPVDQPAFKSLALFLGLIRLVLLGRTHKDERLRDANLPLVKTGCSLNQVSRLVQEHFSTRYYHPAPHGSQGGVGRFGMGGSKSDCLVSPAPTSTA